MTDVRTFSIIFLWFLGGMHFVVTLEIAFRAVRFYSQFINNRIRTLSNLLSAKSLKLLHVIVQPQYAIFLIGSFCGELFSSLIMIVTSIVVNHAVSDYIHYSSGMGAGLNLIPIVFYAFFYFGYYRTYVSKVSLTFKYVNKNISFLKNCRFVNQGKYNFALRGIVDRSIQKRLLNDSFRTRHPMRATTRILQLYNFFGTVINQGAAKALIDTGQNSTITAEQLLRQVCEYFDSYDIEIKTKRLAKKDPSRIYLQQF